MARILVAGGLHSEEEDEELSAARKLFAAALGRTIVNRGHLLLGGCRTGLDAVVAEAAGDQARQLGRDSRKAVKSWVTASTKRTHSEGEIVRSSVSDWKTVPRGFAYPEPFREADVVVVVGGWEGTHYAATWARLANKPLVPVAAFGLAADEIFRDEMDNFDRRYGAQIATGDYEILNRMLADSTPETLASFAVDVVSLAERLITPTDVFVVMSFADRGPLRDAYATFKRVCEKHGLNAFKVDHHIDRQQRIVPAIMTAIRRSAFIIADVSDPRPNVYYELGYAQALGKDVIVTATEGTQLPFDIFDLPTIYWDSQSTLEERLDVEIAALAPRSGRA
jgi:predicted Rossmann-fold nucleotide-binding protein